MDLLIFTTEEQQLLKRIIRDQFDANYDGDMRASIDIDEDLRLISIARKCGFSDLVNEMRSDSGYTTGNHAK